MIDIVQHIKQHSEGLKEGFANLSLEQVKQLKLMALNFYFLLPGAKIVIEQYIHSPLDKEKLIADILNDNTTHYQEIMEQATAAVDEYADEYEELEQLPIFILNAFDHAVAEHTKTESLVELFLGIINTLDYYENFSEEPKYWNRQLEEEVTFQIELLQQLKTLAILDTSIYADRYRGVDFVEL